MQQSDILRQRIGHFQVQSASVSHCANRLRELGYRICTLENLEVGNQPETSLPMDIKDITLQELLDDIVRHNSGYRWEKAKTDLINIFPTLSVLDSKVLSLNIRSKGIWRILKEDLEIEGKGISLFVEFGDADGPPIDLSLSPVDLREALNAIVSQLGQSIWHISGNPGAYYLTISDMPPTVGLRHQKKEQAKKKKEATSPCVTSRGAYANSS